jgi:dihydroneopterin aldolase
MRIDIDERDEQRLNEIKRKRYNGGKGHSETIKWLLDYYEQHESIERLIENKFDQLNEKLENVVIAAFKRFFSNLFSNPQNG